MPVLSNTKHELFAHEVAKGTPIEKAYVIAGYRANANNAARLTKNEGVRARIDEILTKVADKVVVSIENVILELAKLGFANIADYVDVSGKVPTISLANVSREKLAALSEITTETVFERRRSGKPTEVRRVKIKLWDKRAALADIGKHLGGFKDRMEISGPNDGPIETKDVSARDRIASRIAGIAARGRAGGDPRKPE